MLWFIWLFYGALQSINKIDDHLGKISENLEALDDICSIAHEFYRSGEGPNFSTVKQKNRIISRSESELARREKE
jgi:hypothetical protein